METSYEQVTQHLQQASANLSDNKLVEACGELEAAAAALEMLVVACSQRGVEAAPAALDLTVAPRETPTAALPNVPTVRRLRPAATSAVAA